MGKAAAMGKSKTEISRENAGADQTGPMPSLRDLTANIECSAQYSYFEHPHHQGTYLPEPALRVRSAALAFRLTEESSSSKGR